MILVPRVKGTASPRQPVKVQQQVLYGRMPMTPWLISNECIADCTVERWAVCDAVQPNEAQDIARLVKTLEIICKAKPSQTRVHAAGVANEPCASECQHP